MIKQVKQQYGGITKDFAKSQSPGTNYYDAMYGRTTATNNNTEFAFTNEKGTELDLTLPDITIEKTKVKYLDSVINVNVKVTSDTYKNTRVCGSVVTTKGIVFFCESTSDRNKSVSSIFIRIDNVLTLLYVNDLNFSYDKPITALCNYETDKIEKVYWVDGINQLRCLNINHSVKNGDREEIYEIDPLLLNAVAPFKVSQPKIKEVTSGGNHTAGLIQYAYNLYKINGSQTGHSPLSDLVPLVKTNSGGSVNEVVNSLPIIELDGLDTSFDNVIIYSIKYTSLNVEPVINIINDVSIPKDGKLIIYDDGNKQNSISLEKFLFLGSDIYIPSEMEAKFNRLFIANYYEKQLTIDLDMRAFSFDVNKTSLIYHNVKNFDSFEESMVVKGNNYPENNSNKFDSINLDYDRYRYQSDGYTHGGSGKYCKFYLTQSSYNNGKFKFLKDNEIYRLGIVFYNIFGKFSEPIWISDFKARDGNLDGKYNTLDFELTSLFYDDISKITDIYNKPTGYKLVIAERSDSDKTIITSGLLSSMMINTKRTDNSIMNDVEFRKKLSKTEPKLPNFMLRNCVKDKSLMTGKSNPTYPLNNCRDYDLMSRANNSTSEINIGGRRGGRTWQYNKMLQMYSPEAIFNNNIHIPGDVKLNIKGAYKNTFNGVWGKEVWVENNEDDLSVKIYGGISPYDSRVTFEDEANYGLFDYSLISHPGGSNPDRYHRASWFRQYGKQLNNVKEPIVPDASGYKEVSISKAVLENINHTTVKQPEDYDDKPIPFIGASTSFEESDTNGFSLIHSINSSLITKIKIKTTAVNINTNSVVDVRQRISYLNNKSNKYSELESVQTINIPEYDDVLFNNNIEIDLYTTKYSTKFKSNSKKFNVDIKLKINVEYFDKSDKLINSSTISINESSIINFDDVPTGFVTSDDYEKVKNKKEYTINGTPEYTTRGQEFKNYSNLEEGRYVNNLVSFKTDGDSSWKKGGTYGRRIVSINADHAECVTFSLDKSIDEIYDDCQLTLNGAAVYGELVKSKADIYFGSIYGGNRYEDKKRTKYREIGSYVEITDTVKSIHIQSPGDTFVQLFRFLRMSIRNKEIADQGTYQMQEIVEYPCETTIDLKNRNDEHTMNWDSKIVFFPEKYQDYNKVYSQQDSIITHQGSEYYVKEEDSFGATIIPSDQKSAGETIDSWLNRLPNDMLSLDGRYGNIQKLVNFNDEIYAFQNKAIAHLSITPRVQVPTEDGIGLQLGTGEVLPNYNYITQNSGTYNKYSITKTPFGVYYYDDLNASINVFNGQIAPISETSGLHSYIQKYPLKELINAKPYLNTGVTSGYDLINKDMYMTFNFNDYTDTLIFNEKRNMFISRQDDYVGKYIQHDDKLYGTIDGNSLYKYGVGDYNVYYDKKKPTTITFNVNPEVDMDTIINNISFKSEVYKQSIDQPDNTITHIRVYNEYQDTGKVPVVVGRRGNARRFFRDWNIQAPRNKNTRQRVRNPWNYLELTFENTSNLELILHDIVVSFTV